MSKWVHQFRTKVKKLVGSTSRRFVEDTYEFKEDLGGGDISVVKKAVHKKTGEVVAIKIYDKSHLCTFDKERIKAEADILRSLKHPNIINIKEAYDSHRKLYIVMEYMGGGELLDLIKKKKVFPEKEASRIFMQVMAGISYLHSIGIVHRDIKPDNLLLTAGDEAVIKLADFGFAKKVGDSMIYTPCGSPVYTAPEIVREEAYNKSVDIWSAGVLLYILLCGFPPFFHRDPEKLFLVIERGTFDFPDPQWTNISSSAKELVSLLLKREPSERLTAEQALAHPWLQSAAINDNAALSGMVKNLSILNFQEAVEKSISKGDTFVLGSATDSQIWRRRMSKSFCEAKHIYHSGSEKESSDSDIGSYTFHVRVDEVSARTESSSGDEYL